MNKIDEIIRTRTQYKLSTRDCIQILKEENIKRIKESNIFCKGCTDDKSYYNCPNAKLCIEKNCIDQLLSAFDYLEEEQYKTMSEETMKKVYNNKK